MVISNPALPGYPKLSYSRLERIEELYPGIMKIRNISGHYHQTVAMGGGGKLAVEGGNGDTLFLPTSHELTPDMGHACVEAENPAIHALAETSEPRLERRFSFSRRQSLNAPTQFSNSDGADVELRLVTAKPSHHLSVRLGLGEFAEDIRIDEVAHRAIGGEESLARGGTSNGDGQASR